MKKITVILLALPALYSCSNNTGDQKNSARDNLAKANLIPDTTWTSPVSKSKEEWKKVLTTAQFNITREHGTEAPYSSEYNKIKDTGIFYCLGCKNPLFSSLTKFESGTGWPSFYAPYSSKSVSVSSDNTAGMARDEISCQRCGAHLGHVFNDGPKPTGLRYCMNGVAMIFQEEDLDAKIRRATFASGCFWCVEAIYESVPGVREAISGYAGGKKQKPTYEEVGGGQTGHAEAVEVLYDSNKVTYPELLQVYFASQDPTQVNGQGPDHGTAYRSLIFYGNEKEKIFAEQYIADLNKSGKYEKPIAAEVVPSMAFWKAEDYHQDYVALNPGDRYVQVESIPRLKRAQQALPGLIKAGKFLK
jgi:peptide methionine sulfoxide reductase msrA/msrB